MTYTDEQETFRKEVRDWLEANVRTASRPTGQPSDPGAVPGKPGDDQAVPPQDGRERLARTHLAQGVGRQRTSTQQTVVLNEETSRARAPGVSDLGLSLGAPAIMIHGTEEQKKRFVKPTFQGEYTVWQVFTEPEAGSDLASLRTRGIRDGDEWVVNGSKQFVGSNRKPDYLFTLVNTNPDAPAMRTSR